MKSITRYFNKVCAEKYGPLGFSKTRTEFDKKQIVFFGSVKMLYSLLHSSAFVVFQSVPWNLKSIPCVRVRRFIWGWEMRWIDSV